MSSITPIRLRGDSAANWTAINPILRLREVGLELDSRRFKVGDGVTTWSALPYYLDGLEVRGQASRMVDGLVTGLTQGVYVSTGLTATFDSATAYGMTLGTSDLFGLKNTSGMNKLMRFYGSIDARTAADNNKVLGVQLAKNGTAIPQTECRAFTGGNTEEATLVTSWIINMNVNDEVSLLIANHSDNGNISFKRGRIIASEVRS